MRDHLATLLDDFRRFDRQIAVVRFQGIRRRATSYGEIARLAGRFAALLARRGIGSGDRVLLWGENSAEWIAAFHGCILRGVLAVPLDAYGTAEFAARVAADVRPKLVVGDSLLLRQLPAEWPAWPSRSGPAHCPPKRPDRSRGFRARHRFRFSSPPAPPATPRASCLPTATCWPASSPSKKGAQPYLRYERLFHPLRFLETLPLSHVFGQMMGLWVPAIFAAEVHFENRLVAARLIETIKRERISVLAAVPRVMALLKTHLEANLPDLAERVAELREEDWRIWALGALPRRASARSG